MKNKPKRPYKKRKVKVFQEEVGVVQEEVVQENRENGVKCKNCGISLFIELVTNVMIGFAEIA